MNISDQAIGAAITRAREANGVSRSVLIGRLADHGMRVDAAAISRIENGKRSLRLTDACLIAMVLGLELADLVSPDNGSARAEPIELRGAYRRGWQNAARHIIGRIRADAFDTYLSAESGDLDGHQ